VSAHARSAGLKPAFPYQLNRQVVDRVWLERLRQKQLLREGKIIFDCASSIVSNDRKLRVLTEELGEVAKAIDVAEFAASVPLAERKKFAARILAAKGNLRAELTQIAAVAIAWLESLEDDK
jgi:NTP pyrophosphatase (non-canonical NTP hydrolase)